MNELPRVKSPKVLPTPPAASATIPVHGNCAGCWRSAKPAKDEKGVLRCPYCKAEWSERGA